MVPSRCSLSVSETLGCGGTFKGYHEYLPIQGTFLVQHPCPMARQSLLESFQDRSLALQEHPLHFWVSLIVGKLSELNSLSWFIPIPPLLKKGGSCYTVNGADHSPGLVSCPATSSRMTSWSPFQSITSAAAAVKPASSPHPPPPGLLGQRI
jgi:hypothetical protein